MPKIRLRPLVVLVISFFSKFAVAEIPFEMRNILLNPWPKGNLRTSNFDELKINRTNSDSTQIFRSLVRSRVENALKQLKKKENAPLCKIYHEELEIIRQDFLISDSEKQDLPNDLKIQEVLERLSNLLKDAEIECGRASDFNKDFQEITKLNIDGDLGSLNGYVDQSLMINSVFSREIDSIQSQFFADLGLGEMNGGLVFPWLINFKNFLDLTPQVSFEGFVESHQKVGAFIARNTEVQTQTTHQGKILLSHYYFSKRMDFSYSLKNIQTTGDVYDGYRNEFGLLQELGTSSLDRSHSLSFRFLKKTPFENARFGGFQMGTFFYRVKGLVGSGAIGLFELGLSETRIEGGQVLLHPFFVFEIKANSETNKFLGFKTKPTLKFQAQVEESPVSPWERVYSAHPSLQGTMGSRFLKWKGEFSYSYRKSLDSVSLGREYTTTELAGGMSLCWTLQKKWSFLAEFQVKKSVYSGPDLANVQDLWTSHLEGGLLSKIKLGISYEF